MMIYHDLPIPLRCLIILGLFLEVCVGGYLTVTVFRRKVVLWKIFLPLSILASGVLMIIYTAEARSNLRDLALPEVCRWLCGQSALLSISVFLLVAVCYGYLVLDELKYRAHTITRFSIKESVDKLSSGLCFYEEGGRTILVNGRMSQLCHEILGRDLQDAERFWQILSGGEVGPGVERITFGSYPNFRLPDGTVWTFAREELEGFIQLTAADTTLQQKLTDELRDKNLDLAAMNLRLRRYGEKVDELARAKERLETKVRLHGELGQALLRARRYLVDQGTQGPPLDIWRRNIAMLRKEMEAKKGEDPLQILRKAASSAGVELDIRGQLPERMGYRQFFLLAASEALTNAVFHAGARTLNIELWETEGQWTMRFTNDGTRPEKEVVEGGGLGSLRRKTEDMGASMKVESFPEFALTITGRKGEMIDGGCHDRRG